MHDSFYSMRLAQSFGSSQKDTHTVLAAAIGLRELWHWTRGTVAETTPAPEEVQWTAGGISDRIGQAWWTTKLILGCILLGALAGSVLVV